ncbi:MAG TPA: hypothetical protein V6D19_15125 [Stenomitos sp.]
MDANWQKLPVLHVSVPTNQREPLQIFGTQEGLGRLLMAVVYAMGTTEPQEAEVLHPDADVFDVIVQRFDLAEQWQSLVAASVEDEQDAQ